MFENLIKYIEGSEIRPVVSNTYALADIAQAQQDFLSKKHTGKLVLIPPPVSSSEPLDTDIKSDQTEIAL